MGSHGDVIIMISSWKNCWLLFSFTTRHLTGTLHLSTGEFAAWMLHFTHRSLNKYVCQRQMTFWIPFSFKECMNFNKIQLISISIGLSDDKLALVQIMAWCLSAPSHYLNQWWPLIDGVTRQQWVNKIKPEPACCCGRQHFSNLFSWNKVFLFLFIFPWSLFLAVQQTSLYSLITLYSQDYNRSKFEDDAFKIVSVKY